MKKLTGYLLNKLGYQLHNISKDIEIRREQKWSFLKELNIRTILDIGANEGQFAEEVYDIFTNANIYSFEPIQDCYNILVNSFKDRNRFFAFNVALGEKKEQKTFYISSGNPSSSLMKMGQLHKDIFPHTAAINEQMISVETLDSITGLIIQDNLLIKMDVQGAEDKVIMGGASVFRKAKVVITEVSYATLYENQPLFKEIFFLMDSLNFKYIGNMEQFYNPLSRAPLFADAVFVSEEIHKEIFT